MKKILSLISCALLLYSSLHAKPVDANQAREVAQAFLSRMDGEKELTLKDITKETHYTEFHVFALGETGFVLVSADDVAIPILGYSLTSRFETQDLPENVAAWLEDYELEIRSLKSALGLDNTPAPGWGIVKDPNDMPLTDQAVAPLITTTWNQGSNNSVTYNKLCPTISGNRAPTGCVATATAQLMRYWRWPETGYGSHSYTHSSAGELSADFNTTYDWSIMPASLYNSSPTNQIDEVAKLMYHIGVAVEMNYGANSSGAVSMNGVGRDNVYASAQTALMKYFKYSPTMTAVNLGNYTTAEWKTLLKAEIDASRPIFYAGRNAIGGGHAFICDGYDNSDLFHFNWGWGGYLDGYFAIGSLNPGVGGTGGNSSGTYNMDNRALLGVEPYYGTFGTGGTISASATGCSGCSVLGTGAYSFGDIVQLVPSAPAGYRFSHWETGSIDGARAFLPGGGDYSFTAHFEPLAGDTLSYCGRRSEKQMNFMMNTTTRWGIRLPASCLPSGIKLKEVQLYVNVAGTHIFNAYTSEPSPSASVAATATVEYSTSEKGSWQTITLSEPLTLNGSQDLWLTFEYTGNGYPAAVCASTGSNYGLLLGTSATLYNYHGETYPYTLLIRGIFQMDPEEVEIEAGKWYAIASPVHDPGENFESIANVEGLTGGSYDLFRYDEASSTWENQKAAGGATGFSTLELGRGYIYRNSAATTLSFQGQANSGDIDGATLSRSTTAASLAGFHLVGNPYPAPLAFSNISAQSGTLAPGYYSLNGNGSWLARTDGTLAKGEAVLVQVTSPTAQLSFTDAPAAKAAAPAALALTVSDGEHSDVAYAMLRDGAGLAKMSHLEAGLPSLSIPVAGGNYAIAQLGAEADKFDLTFSGAAGTYTLTADNPLATPYLHLIDRATGRDIDMLLGSGYTFSHNGNTQGKARFLVKLAPGGEAGDGIFAFQNSSEVIVNGEGLLEVFDAVGMKVFCMEIAAQATIPNAQFPTTGVYILKLNGKVQKIVVM